MKCKLHEGVDYALNKVSLEHKIPSVSNLMEIPLARFITLAKHDCGCEGKTKELITNWVHPLFLKAHTEDGKEDKPNWNQAINFLFCRQILASCVH